MVTDGCLCAYDYDRCIPLPGYHTFPSSQYKPSRIRSGKRICAAVLLWNLLVRAQPHINSFVIRCRFIGAIVLSLGLNHFILALHQHSEQITSDEMEEREPLWVKAFEDDVSNKYWIRCKQYTVVLLLVLTASLIGFGGYLYSFSFQFVGAAGWILELSGQNSTNHYSVFGLGTSLPSAARDTFAPVLWTITVTYFLFTVVMPLAHILMLIVLWVIPMKYTAQKRMFAGKTIIATIVSERIGWQVASQFSLRQ